MHDSFVWHLLVAAFCGGLLGFERELHRKPAGLRTNMLIALGAAIFTHASLVLNPSRGDPERIAAQIVVGLGFIGAGNILRHDKESVSGLTSAATVWIVGALGLLAGAGEHLRAIVGALLALVILGFLNRVELWIHIRFTQYELVVETEDRNGIQADLTNLLHEMGLDVQPLRIRPIPTTGRLNIKAEYMTTRHGQAKLLRRVGRLPGIHLMQGRQL